MKKSGKCQRSVREKILSGKSGLKLCIVSCIFASILDFAELVHFILVLDHHALLHSYPYTDNNTSTGIIWVTFNVTWAGVSRTIRELSVNFTLSGEWSPCILSASVPASGVEDRIATVWVGDYRLVSPGSYLSIYLSKKSRLGRCKCRDTTRAPNDVN